MVPPCDHCIRGDPQQIDLSTNAIDIILDQTELIRLLIYSGGEPFCNVSIMKYVLSELKRRDIKLYCASFYTNGLVGADKIAEVAREYYEYCTYCRRHDDYKNDGIPINIYVSVDRFHRHNSFALYTIERLKNELAGIAKICKNIMGEFPGDVGRASIYLRDTEDLIPCKPAISMQQVAIHDATHKPICLCYQAFPLKHKDQTWICCDMILTARGTLGHSEPLTRSSYDEEDDLRNLICTMTSTKSIYDDIIKFNTGKLDCVDFRIAEDNLANPTVKYGLEHIGKINEFRSRYRGLNTAVDEPNDITLLERLAMSDPLRILSDDYRKLVIGRMKQRMLDWDGHTITDKSIIERDAALKCKHLNEVRQQTADDMAAINAVWTQQRENKCSED